MGEGVIYRGELSHQKCFNCTECGVELAPEGFYEKEQKPYCPKCVLSKFAKKCPVCSEFITDEPSVMIEQEKSGGKKLAHMTCFKCSKCSKNLMQASMEYIYEDDKIYCFECIKSGDL
ncbi:four and a half LIM domains protein 1-like [Brevipalpus obovatus]|uniref:four and a half LIM domains protein 1-like n=1 Tax=Brevipalpus obovatus TaxID=246614 RepID=UPI003D9EE6CF